MNGGSKILEQPPIMSAPQSHPVDHPTVTGSATVFHALHMPAILLTWRHIVVMSMFLIALLAMASTWSAATLSSRFIPPDDTLLIWAGDQAHKAPDFVAVIDFDRHSHGGFSTLQPGGRRFETSTAHREISWLLNCGQDARGTFQDFRTDGISAKEVAILFPAR
jgi:hypothetical protein